MAAIDELGKLQSVGKTVIWRTNGFRDDAGASAEFFFEENRRVLEQINSIDHTSFVMTTSTACPLVLSKPLYSTGTPSRQDCRKIEIWSAI
jgi:hypothetical protein